MTIMKISHYLLPIAILLLTTAGIFAQDQSEYIVLSAEKYKEIEEKMFEMDDWIPIAIEGYSKAELVAFYIQSYSEESISTWVDFAYKKMKNSPNVKPTAQQEPEFQKILKLPRGPENTHKFMMLMTRDQIEYVGY